MTELRKLTDEALESVDKMVTDVLISEGDDLLAMIGDASEEDLKNIKTMAKSYSAMKALLCEYARAVDVMMMKIKSIEVMVEEMSRNREA